MACSIKCGSYFPGFNQTLLNSNSTASTSKKFPPLNFDVLGKPPVVPDQKKGSRGCSSKIGNKLSVQAETANVEPNMVKIHSAEELVCSLQNAGGRLVIIDFYSPGCGGCKALHPKNPNSIFLEVNYEELKNMCHCLNVHVLPFFRLYRGAEGRLFSFSSANATIKKLKDALAKHGSNQCSLGPANGLDDSELMKLASAGELSASRLQLPSLKAETKEDLAIMRSMGLSASLNSADNNQMKLEKEGTLP
ncbi:Thioredoxin-like 1-1 [Hibiscus syriacus]|uniref:Thioredoxin-like 1-1 n=1 Tax=Hibiscus syriacus TaxID=106335 RepID=A0A6A3CUJ0_HIBSY|nr:Thioredoxin-like 1-1 [Hibiscus syriacus]